MKKRGHRYWGLSGWVILFCMVGLPSCVKEELVSLPDAGREANLIITVSAPDSKVLSRADSERTDRSRIDNMNIVLTDGTNILEILYVDNSSVANPDIPQEESGLVSGQLPTEGQTILYHIGTNDLAEVKDIYVVSNFYGTSGFNLNNYNLQTVSDLRALKQQVPRENRQVATMFGQAEPDGGTDAHGGQNYTVDLKRTIAMITVAVKADGLSEGVVITPRSICLHNIPTECYLGQDNTIDGSNIQPTADGSAQNIVWGDLSSSTDPNTIFGGHGNDPDIAPLLMLENKQGTMNPGNDETKKAPDAGKEGYCSYVELVASYRYTPTEPGKQYIAGTIKYRLYLGSNITDNFDVERNKHYQVTLTLKGMGGMVEDGKTDEDGAVIAEGADASWRIDTDVNFGGSFLTDGINMSSSGYEAYIGFVAEPGKEYVIYCKNENFESWLMAETNMGTISPTPGFPAKIYDYTEVPGGQEGLSYIRIVAAGFPSENWFLGGFDRITDIDDWIENAYREDVLVLAERNGAVIDEVTVRQWLPMPVMVDNSGNRLTNVQKAELFYSRVDVYEGELLLWAPEAYAAWDAQNLITEEGLSFNRPGGEKYNPEYGFDLTAAFYNTDRKGGRYLTFEDDHGHPDSAMGVAIYRAGNMTGSSSVSDGPFSTLRKVGLPSIEEWQKIVEYGAVDPRFPFSNVPYWTSSMEGTQSYTFRYGTGESVLSNRMERHRVRLCYHKSDEATIR